MARVYIPGQASVVKIFLISAIEWGVVCMRHGDEVGRCMTGCTSRDVIVIGYLTAVRRSIWGWSCGEEYPQSDAVIPASRRSTQSESKLERIGELYNPK